MPALLSVLLVVAGVVGVPVGSLLWKLGLGGVPRTWNFEVARFYFRRALEVQSGLIGSSFLTAAVSGGLLAGSALVSCWLAWRARGFRWGLFGLAAVAWAMPGPVVGIGLKRAINLLCAVTGSHAVAVALYYGPSPLPLGWVYAVRFFPFALALLWPVVRLIPEELRESAQLDGATAWQTFCRVALPLTWLAGLRGALALAVLCLGELSASKLLETPGSTTFTHEVFQQMHYGVGNDLAALCLLLLTGGAGLRAGVAWAQWAGASATSQLGRQDGGLTCDYQVEAALAIQAPSLSRNSSSGSSTGLAARRCEPPPR